MAQYFLSSEVQTVHSKDYW